MIYNTRNRSNDITESQKEKRPVLMRSFGTVGQVSGLNKMWPLKGLAMLKCETRTSLHAVQYK